MVNRPKHKTEQLTARLDLRISEKLCNEIARAAQRDGRDPSDWVRRTLAAAVATSNPRKIKS